MNFIKLSLGKIPVFIAVFLLSMILAVGLSAWDTLVFLKTTNTEALETVKKYEAAVDTARNAQVHFKMQVQEWKDLLLRGHDAAAFKKYQAAFDEESNRTAVELNKLQLLFRGLGLDTGAVEEALRTHQELNIKYRTAIALFDQSNSKSVYTVDQAVIGIDRQPTTKIDAIVEMILSRSNNYVLDQKAATRHSFHLAQNQLLAAVMLSFAFGIAVTYFLIKNADRLAQQELELRNQQLASYVDEKTRELQVAMEHVADSERLASLGSIVAGVAHELNTPIGNGVGIGSTLQDQLIDMNQKFKSGQIRRSELEEFFKDGMIGHEILRHNLERAAELVQSFKTVAVDQSSNKRREFNLKTAIQENILALEQMYKNTGFTLTVEVPDDIEMDSFPGPLGQIVTNFITNALLHGFADRSEGSMRLVARLSGTDQVEIIFEDDGNGIAEKHLRHVFEPFFTTRHGKGGSGIGLTIIYNLVHRVLGGVITVSSKIGQGTRFTLIIPLHAPELTSDTAGGPGAEAQSQALHSKKLV